MKIDNFKVEDWFNKYEKAAKYNLGDTCVEAFCLDELFELTKSDIKEVFSRKLNYGDITGSDRLKTAICSLYKDKTSENITVTHGGIGANHLVMLTIIETGDEVVSIIPTYQQHYSIPKSIGANVKLLYLKEENSWLPDVEELEQLVTAKTKIICMNNPNNPTGALIDDDILQNIVEIARQNDCYILCDEVYRGLSHCGNSFSTSIADIYEKGISTGSMSKAFSLAGLRLGWIVAPSDIIEKINIQREYNTISVGIIDDYIATLAPENKDKIIKRNIEKISIGKNILTTWADSEKNVRLVVPKAGTTAFVGYNKKIGSAELCDRLQNETGVMLLPGSAMELDGYFRVGFGNNFQTLETALNIFSDWIRRI